MSTLPWLPGLDSTPFHMAPPPHAMTPPQHAVTPPPRAKTPPPRAKTPPRTVIPAPSMAIPPGPVCQPAAATKNGLATASPEGLGWALSMLSPAPEAPAGCTVSPPNVTSEKLAAAGTSCDQAQSIAAETTAAAALCAQAQLPAAEEVAALAAHSTEVVTAAQAVEVSATEQPAATPQLPFAPPAVELVLVEGAAVREPVVVEVPVPVPVYRVKAVDEEEDKEGRLKHLEILNNKLQIEQLQKVLLQLSMDLGQDRQPASAGTAPPEPSATYIQPIASRSTTSSHRSDVLERARLVRRGMTQL